MKRILVTGGGGFLGSALCEKLLNAGHEVICVDNFFTGSKRNIYKLLDNPKFEKHLEYRRAKTVRIEAPEDFVYSFDGELIRQSHFTVEVVPHAIRFAVPKSARPLPGLMHTPCHEIKEPVGAR